MSGISVPMNKLQISALIGAILLFSGLYFGVSTKPDKQKMLERSRALQGESTGIETLLTEAKTQLPKEATAELATLETALQAATDDSVRTEVLKNLSGWWYRAGNLPVAGIYAEQVADMLGTDQSWSVAGALFFNALTKATEPSKRAFCSAKAVKAFESAASLKPDVVEHRVNLALVYAENPPPDNPMQAVLQLRDLEKQHPDNASVYNALGRLAIKTGQWDRAIERLEKAISLDPKNSNTPCLLAKAYAGAGRQDKASEFEAKCQGN